MQEGREDMPEITFTVSSELYKGLVTAAKEQGLTIKEALTGAAEDFVEENESAKTIMLPGINRALTAMLGKDNNILSIRNV